MENSQSEIPSFLLDAKSYPYKVSKITIKETHISWVFLTGSYAFKVKKKIKFGGVLDFSTLALRKKYCLQEYALNRILCDGMYRGVVKIVKRDGLHLVNLDARGKALEYAVKMVEFPQKYLLDNLLVDKKISTKQVERIADLLVRFHKSTPTNSKISSFGTPLVLLNIVNENFDTLTDLGHSRQSLREKLVTFIKENEKIFAKRIRDGKVRDIHGDLNLQNIFLVKNRFYLYDRIEFNDSLRYGDVAQDVAHLATDFDFYKRQDLSKHFISRYVTKSNDVDLDDIVYFWMCFKSSMRAKVAAFKARNETDKRKIRNHVKEFKERMKLAESYVALF